MSIDHSRDPCPWRILEDAGGAFCMGSIGGGLWHGIRAYSNSPVGRKIRGCLSGARSRAPIVGGGFAIWGGMFSTFDCALIQLRQKEDPWNSIWSGMLTGGTLALRNGASATMRNAVVGGVILAMIEGIAMGMNRILAEQYRPSP